MGQAPSRADSELIGMNAAREQEGGHQDFLADLDSPKINSSGKAAQSCRLIHSGRIFGFGERVR